MPPEHPWLLELLLAVAGGALGGAIAPSVGGLLLAAIETLEARKSPNTDLDSEWQPTRRERRFHRGHDR